MKPYILSAAIWYTDNYIKHTDQPLNIKYGIVIAGRRHSSCYSVLRMINSNFTENDVISGFITSNNLFLCRTDAAQMAWDAGQLLPHIKECPNYLISEMLYWGDDL
jgi:hypothetical protein